MGTEPAPPAGGGRSCEQPDPKRSEGHAQALNKIITTRKIRIEIVMKQLCNNIFLVAAFIFTLVGTSNAQLICYEDPDNPGEYITASGQQCNNAVLTAVPFLRITPDARSGAMGDAGIAISADANAMHYNPSKLAFADKNFSIGATYTPWLRALGLQDVYLAYLSGYKKIDERQTIGLSLRFFSLGDIAFTDEQGQPLGNGRPREFEIAGAYARKLSKRLSAAVGAKFIYSNLASNQVINGVEITPGIAGAADFSLTYKAPVKLGGKKGDLTAAVAFSNIGSKIIYAKTPEFIPANLGIGVAYLMNLDDFNSLAFTVDCNKLLVPTPPLDPETRLKDDNTNLIPDWKEASSIGSLFASFSDAPGGFKEEMDEFTVSTGLEYWYDKQFSVRAGYFHEAVNKGNRKYLSVGLGLRYTTFGINVSYLVPTTSQRNPLDNTLRFSLLFDMANLTDAEE